MTVFKIGGKTVDASKIVWVSEVCPHRMHRTTIITYYVFVIFVDGNDRITIIHKEEAVLQRARDEVDRIWSGLKNIPTIEI